MSGSIGGGLIPQGNGLFLNPITGTYTTGSAGQSGGPMMAQGAPPAQAQASPQQAPRPAAPQQPPASLQGPPPSPSGAMGVPPGYGQAPPTAPQQQTGALSPQTLLALAAAKQKVQQAQQQAAPSTYTPAVGPNAGTTQPLPPGAAQGQPQLAPSPQQAPQGANRGWANNLQDFESGGNPNAVNPNSSAKGPFQFTQGTWNAYLQTPDAKAKGYGPGDVTNPAAARDGFTWLATTNSNALASAGFPNASPGDLVAAHIFGVGDTIAMKRALAANPNTPVGQVLSGTDPNAKAVFAGNAGFVSPDMPVSQVLANTASVAAGTWKNQSAPATAGQGGQAASASPQAPGSFAGTYQQMMNLLPQPKALPTPPTLQGAPQLYGTSVNGPVLGLEFASGLLGAPSLGQGLGRAFGNLAQGYTDQTQYANKARVDATGMNNEAAQGNFKNQFDLTDTQNQSALTRAQTALQLAQFMRPKPLGLSPMQQANGSWAMPMQQPDGSITFQPLPNGATPERLASVQQQEMNKQLADNYKQSVTDLSTQRSSVLAGIDNQRNVDNLLNLLPANGAAIGPSVGAKIIKEFVNLTGLPAGSVTPDGNALTPQAVNDLKLGELPGLKSLFPRGFAGPELKMVNGILPNEDMNPQAVAALAQEMKADIQRRTATIGLWDKLPPDQQNAIMSSPSGFSGWFGQQQQQAYGDTGAQPDPGASISPQGRYTGTAGYHAPSSTAPAQPAAPSLPRVTDAQSYAAIPRGAQYVAPDGITRIKQ